MLSKVIRIHGAGMYARTSGDVVVVSAVVKTCQDYHR